MVSYTNDAMESRGLCLTTRGENVKFFGVLILMIRIEFSRRRSLGAHKDLAISSATSVREYGLPHEIRGASKECHVQLSR